MRLVGIAVMGAGVWLALVAGAAAQTRVTVPIIVKPGASVAGTTGGRVGTPAPAQPGGTRTTNIFVRDGNSAGKLSPGASGGSTNVNIFVRDGRSAVGKVSPGTSTGSRDVNIFVNGGVAVETPIVVVPE